MTDVDGRGAVESLQRRNENRDRNHNSRTRRYDRRELKTAPTAGCPTVPTGRREGNPQHEKYKNEHE